MTVTEQMIDCEIENFQAITREFKNIPEAPNAWATSYIDNAPKNTILIIGQKGKNQSFIQILFKGHGVDSIGIIDESSDNVYNDDIKIDVVFSQIHQMYDNWLIMKKV
jgi:hypothetical protein